MGGLWPSLFPLLMGLMYIYTQRINGKVWLFATTLVSFRFAHILIASRCGRDLPPQMWFASWRTGDANLRSGWPLTQNGSCSSNYAVAPLIESRLWSCSVSRRPTPATTSSSRHCSGVTTRPTAESFCWWGRYRTLLQRLPRRRLRFPGAARRADVPRPWP